ncbi:MAG: DUF4149 domain-containing protein [Acidobacteriota bacterium]
MRAPEYDAASFPRCARGAARPGMDASARVRSGPRSGSWIVLALHLFAIALAIGPPIFFAAAVAPAVFRVLPTRDMAGALQSPILTHACWIAEGSFAVLFFTSWLLGRWWEAPRLSRSLMTRAPILGMICAVVIEKLLIPPIDKIRADAPGLIDSLPAADPARALLARYHRLSTSFFGAEVAVAAVVLIVTARLLASRRAAPAPAVKRPLPKLLDLSDV